MSSMNKVFLMGNLTRDPQLRKTPSGTAVADVGLAINESYRDKDGQEVKTTCFVDIVVWNRQAESCAQYLGKGSPVMVEGRLQLDQWQTAEGEKRSRLRVCANRVQFLGQKRAGLPAAAAEPAAVTVAAGDAGSADDNGTEEGENGAPDILPRERAGHRRRTAVRVEDERQRRGAL